MGKIITIFVNSGNFQFLQISSSAHFRLEVISHRIIECFLCPLQLQKEQFIFTKGEKVLILFSTVAGLCILDETKKRYLALLSSV